MKSRRGLSEVSLGKDRRALQGRVERILSIPRPLRVAKKLAELNPSRLLCPAGSSCLSPHSFARPTERQDGQAASRGGVRVVKASGKRCPCKVHGNTKRTRPWTGQFDRSGFVQNLNGRPFFPQWEVQAQTSALPGEVAAFHSEKPALRKPGKGSRRTSLPLVGVAGKVSRAKLRGQVVDGCPQNGYHSLPRTSFVAGGPVFRLSDRDAENV